MHGDNEKRSRALITHSFDKVISNLYIVELRNVAKVDEDYCRDTDKDWDDRDGHVDLLTSRSGDDNLE